MYKFGEQFNVPIKDGVIKDDNRIRESLKTINYAIDNNAKVILLSHLVKVIFFHYCQCIQRFHT